MNEVGYIYIDIHQNFCFVPPLNAILIQDQQSGLVDLYKFIIQSVYCELLIKRKPLFIHSRTEKIT